MFTLVYGEKFIEMLRSGCARSLTWPRNRAALDGAVWDIYCTIEERGIIRAIVEPIGLEVVWHDSCENLMVAICDHASLCLESGAAMFTAQPDLIFGEGSIEAMVIVASENKRLCVAMAHPRVNTEFLVAMPDGVIGNSTMVELAMQYLHPSFALSDLALDEVNCWNGGIAWRRLGRGLYGVTCNLPTIFLAQFVEEDLPLIKEAGSWDHTWPSALIAEPRQRLIGSSDGAFVVELTDNRTHRPKLRSKPPGAPYTYRGNLPHNLVNRNTVTIWRGSSDEA